MPTASPFRPVGLPAERAKKLEKIPYYNDDERDIASSAESSAEEFLILQTRTTRYSDSFDYKDVIFGRRWYHSVLRDTTFFSA